MSIIVSEVNSERKSGEVRKIEEGGRKGRKNQI